MRLADDITRMSVPKGGVGIFWVGQAGFVLKTDDGWLIGIDLYLSDCCERYFGFQRIMPYLLEPHEIAFDELLISHAHYDHFDVDAVPMLFCPRTHMIAARDAEAECKRLGIRGNIDYIACGETVEEKGFSVKAMPCDHGDLAPDAVGFLITAGTKRIYFAGDTAYRSEYFENPELFGADAAIFPINGAFGNMDGEQAAKAAELCRPKCTLPCHFWNFAEHLGDPNTFITSMKEKNLPYRILRMGEGMVLK